MDEVTIPRPLIIAALQFSLNTKIAPLEILKTKYIMVNPILKPLNLLPQ